MPQFPYNMMNNSMYFYLQFNTVHFDVLVSQLIIIFLCWQ